MAQAHGWVSFAGRAANTREGSLDQYTSMVFAKTIADAVPDRPELPQDFSSSELVAHPLAPGLSPTYAPAPKSNLAPCTSHHARCATARDGA